MPSKFSETACQGQPSRRAQGPAATVTAASWLWTRRKHSSIDGVADRSGVFLANVRPYVPPKTITRIHGGTASSARSRFPDWRRVGCVV